MTYVVFCGVCLFVGGWRMGCVCVLWWGVVCVYVWVFVVVFMAYIFTQTVWRCDTLRRCVDFSLGVWIRHCWTLCVCVIFDCVFVYIYIYIYIYTNCIYYYIQVLHVCVCVLRSTGYKFLYTCVWVCPICIPLMWTFLSHACLCVSVCACVYIHHF